MLVQGTILGLTRLNFLSAWQYGSYPSKFRERTLWLNRGPIVAAGRPPKWWLYMGSVAEAR